MDNYTTLQLALILGILVCMGGMALACVAQLNRAEDAEITAKHWKNEAIAGDKTIGLLWDRIYFLNDENAELERQNVLLDETIAEYIRRVCALDEEVKKRKADADYWCNQFHDNYKCEVCGNTDTNRVCCYRCLEN